MVLFGAYVCDENTPRNFSIPKKKHNSPKSGLRKRRRPLPHPLLHPAPPLRPAPLLHGARPRPIPPNRHVHPVGKDLPPLQGPRLHRHDHQPLHGHVLQHGHQLGRLLPAPLAQQRGALEGKIKLRINSRDVQLLLKT